MSLNIEEILSLISHYCTGPNINNTHIGMPYTSSTDIFSLSKSVMEVMENFGLEAKIVGSTSDGGDNILVFREALELKYSNNSVSHHIIPSSPRIALHIYWKGLASRECNQSSRIMVRLTPNSQIRIYKSA